MVGLEMIVVAVSVRAGPSLNLELLPVGTEVRVRCTPGMYLISALFQGERCKAPWEKRERRCTNAEHEC